jgi:hypothetical protein
MVTKPLLTHLNNVSYSFREIKPICRYEIEKQFCVGARCRVGLRIEIRHRQLLSFALPIVMAMSLFLNAFKIIYIIIEIETE